MAVEKKSLTGLFVVQWLDFPTGNRPYGGGGWSRKARHRPQPEAYQAVVREIEMSGKSFVVRGRRRLKLNIFDVDGGKWVRRDYYELSEGFELQWQLNKEMMADLRGRVGAEPMVVGFRQMSVR